MARLLLRHGTVFHGPALKLSTELFIVDTSPTAALALGAHRPTEEATYVLCRAASELGVEFARRVLRRACQIRRHRSIGSLWFVIGTVRSEPLGSELLLESLLPLVDTGGTVIVAGSWNQGGAVQQWLDAFRARPHVAIDLQLRLFPDVTEGRSVSGPSLARAERRSAPAAPARFASDDRTRSVLLDVAI